MKITITVLLVLTSLALSNLMSGSYAADIKPTASVEVTDSSSNQTITLNDDTELNRFNYYWSQKKALQSTRVQSFQWRYQLVIQDKNKLSRWVYDPRGYARQLTFDESSLIYQFSSIRSFNRYLSNLNSKQKNKGL